MKNIMKLSLMILPLIILVGCGTKKQELMTCTRTANQNNIKMNFDYKVHYTGDYVNVIETTETVESDSSDYLNTLKTTVENMYASYKDIEHYDTKVTVDGNKLTSNVKIDYDKIDTKKLIEIDSANGQIIKDGKIKVDDIKSMYETIGATCSK